MEDQEASRPKLDSFADMQNSGRSHNESPDVEEVPKAEKSDSMARWAVLALSCLAMIGNYYCFDNPAALKTSLSEFVGLSETQYNMM